MLELPRQGVRQAADVLLVLCLLGASAVETIVVPSPCEVVLTDEGPEPLLVAAEECWACRPPLKQSATFCFPDGRSGGQSRS